MFCSLIDVITVEDVVVLCVEYVQASKWWWMVMIGLRELALTVTITAIHLNSEIMPAQTSSTWPCTFYHLLGHQKRAVKKSQWTRTLCYVRVVTSTMLAKKRMFYHILYTITATQLKLRHTVIAGKVGSHHIWWYRQNCLFKIDRFKFWWYMIVRYNSRDEFDRLTLAVLKLTSKLPALTAFPLIH